MGIWDSPCRLEDVCGGTYLFFKKGISFSYRGVTLLSLPNKAYARVLKRRNLGLRRYQADLF